MQVVEDLGCSCKETRLKVGGLHLLLVVLHLVATGEGAADACFGSWPVARELGLHLTLQLLEEPPNLRFAGRIGPDAETANSVDAKWSDSSAKAEHSSG